MDIREQIIQKVMRSLEGRVDPEISDIIQDVAVILGHADLKTTQIYCYISQKNVKTAYDKYAAQETGHFLLRLYSRSFCCAKKQKGREGEFQANIELNTKLGEKANLHGENTYDSTNKVSKIIGINKNSFASAQFIAEAPCNQDPTCRSGYGFHNVGVIGGFLYLDNDYKLKFIDSRGAVHTIVME